MSSEPRCKHSLESWGRHGTLSPHTDLRYLYGRYQISKYFNMDWGTVKEYKYAAKLTLCIPQHFMIEKLYLQGWSITWYQKIKWKHLLCLLDFSCKGTAQQFLKSLIILLIIEYGNQEKQITDFQISTCPTSKTTCQGNKTSVICMPWKLYVEHTTVLKIYTHYFYNDKTYGEHLKLIIICTFHRLQLFEESVNNHQLFYINVCCFYQFNCSLCMHSILLYFHLYRAFTHKPFREGESKTVLNAIE